jgi:rare lipoprotein A
MSQLASCESGDDRTLATAIRGPRGAFLLLLVAPFLAILVGCGGAPPRAPSSEAPPASRSKAGEPPSPVKRGGYYLDDGPGDNPPPNLDSIPDAVPKPESLRPASNRPYEVFGRTYSPLTSVKPYREKGVASWYGRRYHGKPTSSGEVYDMYAMTAAHPTLPIPSYARVTNLRTNQAVVVRINDRGPFLHERVIDLSYVAAHRIGTLSGGSGLVEVELIVPGPAAGRNSVAALAGSGSEAPRAATLVTAPTPRALASESVSGQSVPPSTPTPRAEPVATPPSASVASAQQPMLKEVNGSSGIFLQMGAFSTRDNAEGFVTRLRGLAAELTDNLQVYPRDGLYRVQIGPYGSDGDARSAADRLAARLGIRAVVTTR